jgi:glutaredoxin
MLTIYTKDNCGYCLQAKALLKNNDIDFEEINVQENTNAHEFLISQGHRTLPQIYRNGVLFVAGGYTGLRDLGVSAIREKIRGIDIAALGSI